MGKGKHIEVGSEPPANTASLLMDMTTLQFGGALPPGRRTFNLLYEKMLNAGSCDPSGDLVRFTQGLKHSVNDQFIDVFTESYQLSVTNPERMKEFLDSISGLTRKVSERQAMLDDGTHGNRLDQQTCRNLEVQLREDKDAILRAEKAEWGKAVRMEETPGENLTPEEHAYVETVSDIRRRFLEHIRKKGGFETRIENAPDYSEWGKKTQRAKIEAEAAEIEKTGKYKPYGR
jgi:hypothetical protein